MDVPKHVSYIIFIYKVLLLLEQCSVFERLQVYKIIISFGFTEQTIKHCFAVRFQWFCFSCEICCMRSFCLSFLFGCTVGLKSVIKCLTLNWLVMKKIEDFNGF